MPIKANFYKCIFDSHLRRKLIIVGGGSCALMLGATLDEKLYDIHIYEKNAALGRKFLVAGDGGLNLTHSESAQSFLSRYSPSGFLNKSFATFNNQYLINWFVQEGVDLFTGSSGRVFPEKKYKPVEVLNVFLEKIKRKNIEVHFRHSWKGFGAENKTLLFETKDGSVEVKADIIVFCLGGASWPVTGSAGEWLDYFSAANIRTKEFKASNCSVVINWPVELQNKIEGKALKNIALRCGRQIHRGEVVLTKSGLEGSGVYPLSPFIREELTQSGMATLFLDLKPMLSFEDVEQRIKAIKKSEGYTESLRKSLNLGDVQITLLKSRLSKEEFLSARSLAEKVKALPLEVQATGPIVDAISTVGGICLDEINENFELKKLNEHYVLGEMLDYDAPTGGYLLQSCFTMALYVAGYLNGR